MINTLAVKIEEVMTRETIAEDLRMLLDTKRTSANRMKMPLPSDNGYERELLAAAYTLYSRAKVKPAEWQGLDMAMEKKILAGKVSNLVVPRSYIEELRECNNGRLKPEDLHAKGYQFAWGQLIENSGIDIEKQKRIEWEIRFDSLHAEYLAAGMGIGDMEDLAIMIMKEFLPMFSPDHTHQGLRFIEGGLQDTTCLTFSLTDPRREGPARQWICSKLLNGSPTILGITFNELRNMIDEYSPRMVKFYNYHRRGKGNVGGSVLKAYK